MQNIDDIIAAAKLPEKTVPLCLRGDLQAVWEDLERQLTAVTDDGEDTLAGPDKSAGRALAERMEAIRGEMLEHTAQFRLRALSSKAWDDLVTKHAPSKEEREAGAEINGQTFGVALLAACAVDPPMSEDQAGRLVDSITNRQWLELYTGARSLNQLAVDIPFSPRASALLRSSAPE